MNRKSNTPKLEMSFNERTVLPKMSYKAVHDLANLITLSSLRALRAYILEPTDFFCSIVRIKPKHQSTRDKLTTTASNRLNLSCI
jgi:hypothetical protein